MLHQRRPGRRGSRRRPARPGRPPRDGAARRRCRHRLRRGQLPPPAGRRPRQRPGAARAARPRDPDLSPGRGPRHRSRDDHLQGRRDQPHRPPSGRHRGHRRGLPGRAQPDGIPVARPRTASPPTRSAGSISSGRTAATPGSTSPPRSSARSRRSAPTRARSTTPTAWPSGSGHGPARKARRSGRPRPKPSGS